MTGFGGGNAAVLLEDYPSDSVSSSRMESDQNGYDNKAQIPRLFVLSAKSETSLKAQAATFAEHLQGATVQESQFLRDLSYTLGRRRTHFSDRLAVTASSLSDLQKELTEPGLCKRGRSRSHTIAFVFTGQGAQYQKMGVELSRYEVFAQTLHDADKQLAEFGAGWSLAGSKA
jgi:acyl transferase domain-containing protein